MTDGGDPTKEYSAEDIRALGARMNAVGKMAQDFGLTLGYHPHFGTIGETRQGLGRVLDATDPRYVKLIADVAHMALGGSDPAEVIRTYGQRLCFLHLKDTRKEVAAVARQDRNRVEAMGPPFAKSGWAWSTTLPWSRRCAPFDSPAGELSSWIPAIRPWAAPTPPRLRIGMPCVSSVSTYKMLCALTTSAAEC